MWSPPGRPAAGGPQAPSAGASSASSTILPPAMGPLDCQPIPASGRKPYLKPSAAGGLSDRQSFLCSRSAVAQWMKSTSRRFGVHCPAHAGKLDPLMGPQEGEALPARRRLCLGGTQAPATGGAALSGASSRSASGEGHVGFPEAPSLDGKMRSWQTTDLPVIAATDPIERCARAVRTPEQNVSCAYVCMDATVRSSARPPEATEGERA